MTFHLTNKRSATWALAQVHFSSLMGSMGFKTSCMENLHVPTPVQAQHEGNQLSAVQKS